MIQKQRTEHSGGAVEQLVTFEVGAATLALDISSIREINRNLKLTNVPQAPSIVRGVTNLRGEVVTIIDVHEILGMPSAETTSASRNLIVNCEDELIGLRVDRVSDIMTIERGDISLPPSNLQGVPRKLIHGVYQAPTRLVMLLELDELLASCNLNVEGVC